MDVHLPWENIALLYGGIATAGAIKQHLRNLRQFFVENYDAAFNEPKQGGNRKVQPHTVEYARKKHAERLDQHKDIFRARFDQHRRDGTFARGDPIGRQYIPITSDGQILGNIPSPAPEDPNARPEYMKTYYEHQERLRSQWQYWANAPRISIEPEFTRERLPTPGPNDPYIPSFEDIKTVREKLAQREDQKKKRKEEKERRAAEKAAQAALEGTGNTDKPNARKYSGTADSGTPKRVKLSGHQDQGSATTTNHYDGNAICPTLNGSRDPIIPSQTALGAIRAYHPYGYPANTAYNAMHAPENPAPVPEPYTSGSSLEQSAPLPVPPVNPGAGTAPYARNLAYGGQPRAGTLPSSMYPDLATRQGMGNSYLRSTNNTFGTNSSAAFQPPMHQNNMPMRTEAFFPIQGSIPPYPSERYENFDQGQDHALYSFANPTANNNRNYVTNFTLNNNGMSMNPSMWPGTGDLNNIQMNSYATDPWYGLPDHANYGLAQAAGATNVGGMTTTAAEDLGVMPTEVPNGSDVVPAAFYGDTQQSQEHEYSVAPVSQGDQYDGGALDYVQGQYQNGLGGDLNVQNGGFSGPYEGLTDEGQGYTDPQGFEGHVNLDQNPELANSQPEAAYTGQDITYQSAETGIEPEEDSLSPGQYPECTNSEPQNEDTGGNTDHRPIETGVESEEAPISQEQEPLPFPDTENPNGFVGFAGFQSGEDIDDLLEKSIEMQRQLLERRIREGSDHEEFELDMAKRFKEYQ